MSIKRLMLAGCAALAFSACDDLIAGLQAAAEAANIDTTATIDDHQKATGAFQATFFELQGVVSDSVAVAAGGGTTTDGATDTTASSSLAPQQAQTVDINTTVEHNGGTITIVGFVESVASENGVSQSQELTVTWTNIAAETQGVTFTTDGKTVISANFDLGGSVGFTGIASQLGEITVDGETFGFDIVVTITATGISYEGTINGVTEEFTISFEDLGAGPDGPGAVTDTTGPATDTTDADDLVADGGDCDDDPGANIACFDDGSDPVTGIVIEFDQTLRDVFGKYALIFRNPANQTQTRPQIQYPTDLDVQTDENYTSDDGIVISWTDSDGNSWITGSILAGTGAVVRFTEYDAEGKTTGVFTATGVSSQVPGEEMEVQGTFHIVLQ